MASERGNEELFSVYKTEEIFIDEKEPLRLGSNIFPNSDEEVNNDSSLLQEPVMSDEGEPMDIDDQSIPSPIQSVSDSIMNGDEKYPSKDNANKGESASSSPILSRSSSFPYSETNEPVNTSPPSVPHSETNEPVNTSPPSVPYSKRNEPVNTSPPSVPHSETNEPVNTSPPSVPHSETNEPVNTSPPSVPYSKRNEPVNTSPPSVPHSETNEPVNTSPPSVPYSERNEPVNTSPPSVPYSERNELVNTSPPSVPENDSVLEDKLKKLGLSEKDIEYVLSQGKKFLEKPHLLAKKLNVCIEISESALNLLKLSLSEPEISLTREEIQKIEKYMKETPDCDAQEIALMCDIEEALVAKYLLSLPLTPDQKARVSELFQSNCSTRDIANMLKLSIEKVDEYVEKTFITLDREHKMDMQMTEMKQIVKTFGNTQLTFHSSRMIVSDSFEEKIQKSDWSSKKPKNAFNELLPQIFYYLRCSLPLEDLSNMIMLSYRGVFTTHDLFHLIFQLSDPVLRGFCIENYSFSNPVPLVYTQLPKLNSARLTTTVCEELWYTLEDFNGLVSFGIGRASWNPVGKSYLLDLIFETDFVKGSPQGSAFHYSSIDIQMTRNLFGEMKGTSIKESTKWAYIDCHGESNVDYIQVICQHIGIALIHVTYHDFMNNREIVDSDIKKFTTNVKYIYLLIRDCEKAEENVKREEKKISGKTINFVYIPNLTKCNVRRIPFVKNALKKFGNEILHLEHDTINSLFIEILLADSKCDGLMDIQSGKELIKMITNYIHKVTTRSLGEKDVDFSFLRYYPNFVEYMSCYHKAAFATDHETISRLNSRCARLQDKYQTIGIGEVARHFNEIMNLKNSTLFIWKLSKELTNLSKLIQEKPLLMRDEITEQKNTKFIIEILWREALLTHKYQPRDKTYAEKFAQNFSNHVERGEAFELIDGDNLRFFNRDIDELLRGLYEKRMLELEIKNRGKKILIKQAPIIVSIIGPQSSGKSTLLNYCFGCKFLTSAGRCTRGIYGSLSKLSRPVNLTEHFLILDTEGLDAIERGNIQDTSHIHFDRTMVLFCLSVSQVVIINVKGDLGSEMQNLLQICAYSLNKLKVSKVAVPKIFFVLNQQADPDQSKHIGSINSLLEKLDKESGLMDAGDIKISDFIQISQENLFILPSAFNSEQINKPNAQLFSSNVSKLSPTVEFAGKCAEIRLAIINQLDNMPIDDRQPFGTMSEWMDMAGTVWETIVKYQDIVKYRNVEELMCIL